MGIVFNSEGPWIIWRFPGTGVFLISRRSDYVDGLVTTFVLAHRKGLITNIREITGHLMVSFGRRHSRRQTGASNLVLPSPRNRPTVQQQTRISIDQFDHFLDPTVREAFADVVLFFQVKCQRE